MTKPRDLDSLSCVIGRAIELIGAGAVAQAIGGKSNSFVYQAADPDNPTTISDINVLIEIDRACVRSAKTAPCLAFLAKKIGFTEEDEREIEDDVLLLTERTGRVAKRLRDARDPNSPDGPEISACEARQLKEGTQEVREACDRIDASVVVASTSRLRTVATEQGP